MVSEPPAPSMRFLPLLPVILLGEESPVALISAKVPPKLELRIRFSMEPETRDDCNDRENDVRTVSFPAESEMVSKSESRMKRSSPAPPTRLSATESPNPPLSVSLPSPPTRVSLPAPPSSELSPAFPVMLLAMLLPMALIFATPVRTRFSMPRTFVAPMLKVTELSTMSVPPMSLIKSVVLSTT